MKHSLQFKITLRGIKPPIWRRILVPEDYTFWDLHVAIQDAMDGWLNYHLHLFTVSPPFVREKIQVGIPGGDGLDHESIWPGWEVPITTFFGLNQRRGRYLYDFGDDWEHDLLLEAIRPQEKGAVYPQCIGGRRQCPPEDCGGPGAFQEFLLVMANPAHQEYQFYLEWHGEPFDPEEFDPRRIQFNDPDKVWDYAFAEDHGGVQFEELHQPARWERIRRE